MKSAKGRHQDPEEEEDEEFGSAKKENPPSNCNSKDGKNSEKANAIRSKHSVTEQRRRCKINERFQILRDLIPHSDQKRDTASFLLEVIEYVKLLQDTVQKYEGSYQGWASEPTKLMPWRTNHWRVHSFVGHPQAINNDSSPGATYPGRFNDNNVTMLTNTQNRIETDPGTDGSCKAVDQQPELANKGVTMPIVLQPSMSVPAQGDSLYSHSLLRPVSETQPTGYPIVSDALNHNEELTIEGGTISISSAYSQGLLDSLTQALQVAGLDLSEATLSVQIDLGKRANKKLTLGMSVAKDHENSPSSIQPLGNLQSASNGGDSDQAQKRRKI